MSTEYNASEIDRLVREGTEDNERMTPGTWTTDVIVDTADHEVIAPNNRTWTPGGYDMGEDKPVAAAIARTRNNLPATVAALSAAKAEVERLTTLHQAAYAQATANLRHWDDAALERDELRVDRDRLAAEVERLTKERDEARESVEFKEWFSSLRDQIDRGNSTAWAKLVKENTRLSARVRELESEVAAAKLVADPDNETPELSLRDRIMHIGEQAALLTSVVRTCDEARARVRELELTEEEREAADATTILLRALFDAAEADDANRDPHTVTLALLDRLVKGGR